ncbi:hypothetical protein [Streptomyces sp. NPDC047315]|uniref:hypothetical protein n=1 Tax=Streptomyces sp. NPDC047315 TaxID=3155142 RepID=UPI0033E24C17
MADVNEDGTARWDARAQRWERDEKPVPYTAPPPPFPRLPPQWDPSGTGAPAETVQIGADGQAIPPSPATARRRRTRTVALVGAATAAVAAVATVVWYVLLDDDSPPSRPGSSASASDGADGSGESGESSERLDSIDYTVTQVEGYTVAVPDGWLRDTSSSSVAYNDPSGDDRLMVMDFSDTSETPLALVTKSDTDLTGQLGYRRVKLGYVQSGPENPTSDAAELTYRFQQSPSEEMRTCIERAFTGDDGDVHVVYVCGATSDMPYQRRLMNTVLEHFDPPGY